MNGEQLYSKLKLGEIKKTQLTVDDLSKVYKYMVDSKKVSIKDFKPEVASKFNLNNDKTYTDMVSGFNTGNKPQTITPIAPSKVEESKTVPSFDNYDGYYTGMNNDFTNFNSTNKPTFNLPQFNPPINKPANSEMELADLLSSYSFTDRGMPTQNYINDIGDRGMPIQQTNNNPNLLQRIGYGLSSIGKNYASGNLNAIATVSEAGNKMLQNITGYNMPDDKRLEIANKLGIPSTLQVMKDSDSLAQSAAKDTQKGKQGLGTVGSTVYDIFQGAGQMGADIGTAVTLGTNLMPILGTRVFGQSAGEARQKGANLGQQIAYGTLSAGLEMATEKLIGGIPLADKLGMGGVADDALQNAAINLAKVIKSSPRVAKGFVYLANMLGEGAEEAISEVFTPILQRMTYDPNANLAGWEEILYSALLGAGISGVMGGGVVGNPEVDFNISESYNPTDKVEFNPQDFNANIPYEDKPRNYAQTNNIQETLDTGLNQLYNALDIEVDEQAIDKMINNLEQVKQAMPKLSNYVDNQIERLNSYTNEPFKQLITDENKLVEVLVNNDTNIAQNSNKDVINDINNIGTQTVDNQENTLQEVNNSVTETQQIEPIIEEPTTEKPIVEDTTNNEMQTVSNMPIDNAIEQPTTQSTEQTEDTNVTEDKSVDGKLKETVEIKDFADKLLRDKIKEGYELSEEQKNEELEFNKKLGEKLVNAINNKDFDYLTENLNRGNLRSLELFSNITGLSTKNQKDITNSIRALDTNLFDKWQQEIKNKEKKAETESKKTIDTEEREKVLSNKIRYDGKVFTFKEFVDYLIKEKNFTYIEEGKQGVIPVIKLSNPEQTNVYQTFKNKYEKEYVKERVELAAKEAKGVQKELKTDVAKKETTEKQTYRYYLTQRPPSPGTFPKGTTNIVSFDDKTDGAWGYVEYDKPLTETQKLEYELVEKTEYEFDKALKEAAKKEGKQTETVTETKEEQIEETKEELKERVEKMQETGTSYLSPNETKIYNYLVANKDTDVDELMNSFEIPRSNADGFDSQQRYVFVQKLIEGAIKEETFNAVVMKKVKNSRGDTVEAQGLDTVTAKVITIDIPRDGTFRIKPDYGSVSIIINRLGVKLKTQIPNNFKSVFSKELAVGDDFYTNGYIAVKADESLLEEIKSEYENYRRLLDEKRIFKNFIPKDAEFTEVKDNPYLTLEKVVKDKGYFFVVDGEAYLYNQKYVDFLNKDGNKFYIDTNGIGLMKAENTNGETIGFVLPIKHDKKTIPNFKDGNSYQPTKQNFFSKPKKENSKKNTVKEETQDELKTKLDDLISKKSLALSEAEAKEIDKQIGLLKLKLQLFASSDTDQVDGDFETSQFYTNSIKNALIIPDNVKEMVDETDFLYGVQTNKGQLDEAFSNIEKDMEGVIRKIKQAKAIESGIQSAEALLVERIYIEQGNQTGDYSKAIEWLKIIQPKITKTAQALQTTSMWKRFTTENTLLQASKAKEEARIPSEEKTIDETSDKLKGEFDKVDKDTADDIANDVQDNVDDVIADKRAKDDVIDGSTGSKEDIDNAKKKVDKAQKDVDNAENVVIETDKEAELKKAKLEAKRAKKSEAKSQAEIDKLDKDIEVAQKEAEIAIQRASLAKDNLKKLKSRLRKYKSILKKATDNEVNYKKEEKITQEEIDAIKAEQLLAAKVEMTLKDPKAQERDLLLEMVNELMNVAKESPLPRKEMPKTDPIEFIAQAISNREEYVRVWKQAKQILLDKYGENNEVMDMLSDYFEKGIKPTFSVKTLDRVMSKYIVGLKIAKTDLKKANTKSTLSEVVRNWYATGKNKTESMIEDMINSSGLNEDEAKILEKYVRNRMHVLTKQKKEQILANMFKESIPKANAGATAIETMTNLGAFNNDKYKELAKIKLDRELKRILGELDIDMGKIAKQSANIGKVTKEAVIEILRGQLQINPVELEKVAGFIAESFDKILGEKKASILRQLTKEREVAEKRAFYEKIVEMYNLGGFETQEHREWIAKKLKLPHLDDKTVERIITLTKTLEKIPTIGLYNNIIRDMIQTEIAYIVANLVPPSRMRQASTAQAAMQLVNLKTTERNILGNELAYRSERIAKYVGTLIDYSMSKLKGTQRKVTFKKNVKLFDDFKPQFGKDMLKAAKAVLKGFKLYGWDDSKNVIDFAKGGKVFKGTWNPFNYLETTMNILLDPPDYAAMMRSVYDFVAEQAYLDGMNKGLKGAELEKNAKEYADNLTTEMYLLAREYGDFMTFKDKDSIVGNLFGGIKRTLNLNKEFGLGDLLLKYSRTGGVLFARSIEFSPIGFITSYRHVIQAKQAYNNKKEYTKDVQREVEMSIARALFGTIGFTGLGYALSSLGIISGSDDEDDYLVSELRKRVGLGRYQINLSALFRWTTSFDKEKAKRKDGDLMMTYDWAMPMSMSITYGVDLQKKGISKDIITSTVSSFDSMMNMFNQSNLTKGIRDLFKGYDEGKNIKNLVQNSMTSFTGTFNNQLRQLFDNVSRDTSSDNFVKESINKIMNRLPLLSKTLPEQIDITGEVKEVYQNDTNNIFNVFLNPSFVTKYEYVPEIDFMLGLYDELETLKAIPNKAQDYLTIDGVKVPLTEKERKMLAEMQGELTLKVIRQLMSDKKFIESNKETQVKRVDAAIRYVSDFSRSQVKGYVTKRIKEGQ